MKRISYILSLILAISLTMVSCEIDNYDGPDATISGKFLDSTTGELVGTDITDGNSIGVYELGWKTEAKQTWNIKNTGEYANNLVFASTYRIEFTNCNFFPFVVNDFVVNKGSNTYDFSVTPYLRVVNPTITYDDATKTVTARFSLQTGGSNVRLNEIRLFAFTDQWVGNYVKFPITSASCYKKAPAAVSATVTPETIYELKMDVAANAASFKYTRNYYFRIGALANVSGVGTVRYNYSPVVAINIPR
ncbi:MAG TPA: DUF3823 domain-containing protein [Bacteroidales bacterium]|nr:DUF3823 domain-containing protein [Bacteroidales bacterium]